MVLTQAILVNLLNKERWLSSKLRTDYVLRSCKEEMIQPHTWKAHPERSWFNNEAITISSAHNKFKNKVHHSTMVNSNNSNNPNNFNNLNKLSLSTTHTPNTQERIWNRENSRISKKRIDSEMNNKLNNGLNNNISHKIINKCNRYNNLSINVKLL